MPLTHLPIPLLRAAIKIREKIDNLTAELMSLIRDEEKSSPRKPAAKGRGGKKGKRTLSQEAREKIAAAQARRWARVKGRPAAATKSKAKAKTKKAKPAKRVLSAEAREKIAAAQRKRWAKSRR